MLQHKKPPRTPITRELAVLYKRTFTEIIRNPTLLLMHCVMALVMGLLCGGIFWHISNDIAGAQNRLGTVLIQTAPCISARLPAACLHAYGYPPCYSEYGSSAACIVEHFIREGPLVLLPSNDSPMWESGCALSRMQYARRAADMVAGCVRIEASTCHA